MSVKKTPKPRMTTVAVKELNRLREIEKLEIALYSGFEKFDDFQKAEDRIHELIKPFLDH